MFDLITIGRAKRLGHKTVLFQGNWWTLGGLDETGCRQSATHPTLGTRAFDLHVPVLAKRGDR